MGAFKRSSDVQISVLPPPAFKLLASVAKFFTLSQFSYTMPKHTSSRWAKFQGFVSVYKMSSVNKHIEVNHVHFNDRKSLFYCKEEADRLIKATLEADNQTLVKQEFRYGSVFTREFELPTGYQENKQLFL